VNDFAFYGEQLSRQECKCIKYHVTFWDISHA
jgi:hypothetical protein